MTIETRIHARSRAESLADDAAGKSEQAIAAARRAADGALDALHDKVNALHDMIPGAFSRAATRVDEMTRRSIDRARQTSADVRDRVGQAGDVTVRYIKDEPVKSILLAAAAGAALAALITMLSRSREASRR
ncbi:MAG TPA: hypothetical protein VGQ91_15070 [Ideonella sp.]|jgi:ElaB/YqjD/DUF883 family membrane-anchored ribosome-binding protein|nr:hypothetical protein [Ideonella sp.]